MRLGIDSYSLRWQSWDAFRMLEYAAGLGLENVQFSERGNLASLDEGYLRELRGRADELGLTIELGMGSFDRHARSFRPEWGSGEEQLGAMLRAAAVFGSPIVRCFLGAQDERDGPLPLAEHIAECVRVLRAVAPLARELGVRIAVENHGGVDLLARELLGLVEAAGTDVVGVCLDTGNPAYAAEDPVLATEILAPYVLSTHVRDTRVWTVAGGAMAQWSPIGAGDIDLARILAILAERAPAAPINLEIITGTPAQSLPYLDPASGFWSRYPDMPARDFARFVALAARGTPGPLDQLTLPPGVRVPPEADADAFRAQQRRDFEESVRHCREVLHISS
jgi:3-oxoisoapionate decarboxylase